MARSVLVSILDWGLGHATRCAPVIRELQKQNFRVVIGGSGPSLQFLKNEFRGLTFYDLPSYEIVYPENGNLLRSLLLQAPRILKKIKLEHFATQRIVEKEDLNYLISDNRYGCYSKKIKSIFIGHQLHLKLPSSISFFSGIINSLHLRQIRNFNEVWVPDEPEGLRLSGKLSKNSLPNSKYIGILSRFGNGEPQVAERYEFVGLVSGPEPQRTIFENILREQFVRSNCKSIMVKGKPGSTQVGQHGNIAEADHLESILLESILANCGAVVCRSGYSTIMDLSVLGKKVIFVPTPGQTEQEYLGEYLSDKKIAVCQRQSEFDLATALNRLESILPLPVMNPNSFLREAIQSL